MATTVDIDRPAATRAMARPVNWGVCVTLFFLGNVLLWADRTNFSVAASVWSKQYGWTPAVIGTILSAFSFGYMLMQPFGGWIADRFGPRRAFWASCAGWSFWVLLTPIAPAMTGLVAAFRALLGIFESPFTPAYMAAASRAIPSDKRRAKFMAFMQSGAYLGPACGVFLASAVLGWTHNPAMIFIVFAVIGFALAGGWWLYARGRSDPAPTEAEANTIEARTRAAIAPASVRTLLFTGALWPLYLSWAALPYANYIFLTWLPPYLSNYRHLPVVQAGFLSTLPFLAGFLAQICAGFLMDWIAQKGWDRGPLALHRKLFVYVGAAIYTVGTLTAATTSSTTLAVVMIVIAMIGLATYSTPFFIMVSDIAPNQTGLVVGITNFFGLVGGTLSPFISGIIAQKTGAFVAPLQLAVALIVIGAILMAFFKLKPVGLVTTPVPLEP
jgi:MFS family permease